MGRHRCRRAALVLGAMLLLPLAGCAALFRGPILPPEPLPVAPFLDMHCHVAGLGAGGSGCFVSERLRRSWKVGFYFRSFGVSRRELEQRGDALCADRLSTMLGQSRHVGRAVVLALDGAVDDRGNLDAARTEFYVPNEFVAALAARHTNLLFGASVNPYRPDALARLDRAAADHAVLVKWLPSIQLIDPADERLAPFYRRMAELRLPLLVHTGTEHSFTWSKDEFADPARLRLPLSLGVTVIAAHAAWPGRHDGQRDVDRLGVPHAGIPEPLRGHLLAHPDQQARRPARGPAPPRVSRPPRLWHRFPPHQHADRLPVVLPPGPVAAPAVANQPHQESLGPRRRPQAGPRRARGRFHPGGEIAALHSIRQPMNKPGKCN